MKKPFSAIVLDATDRVLPEQYRGIPVDTVAAAMVDDFKREQSGERLCLSAEIREMGAPIA